MTLPWDTTMELIDLALREDIGTGDVTTRSVVPPDRMARATMLAKQEGVISGLDVAGAIFQRVDPEIAFEALVVNGASVGRRTPIARLSGPARSILTAERVALNVIQRLSGVATLTRQFVERIEGTNGIIVDTRKTTPGLRVLEKRAVVDGGGQNHRFNLADGVLIRDNHLAAVGTKDRVTEAIRLARRHAPHTIRIEVEVTTLAEVAEAVDAGADIILLDNMDVETMREAVVLVNGRALTEASGGVNLDTVRAIAETGVDLISVGALTHSAPALDISLDIALSE